MIRSNLPIRTPHAKWGAKLTCIAGILLLLAGCYSHQERWGRDPRKIRRAPARGEEAQIELAKNEVTAAPATDDPEALTPVQVLFVNSDPITVEDVLRWIRPELRKMADSLSPQQYQTELIDRLKREVRRRAESQLLYQVATRRLGEREKERLESVVDARVREIVNTEHGGRQTRYERDLRQRGIQPEQDRERIRRELLVGAYLQSTIGDRVTEPTRRELEEYYQEYLSDIAEKERRRLLLVDVPIGREDAVGNPLDEPRSADEARAECVAARGELLGGADFAEVASKYSQGINALSGGDWGMMTRTGVRQRWTPAVEALYKLDEGGVSDVIETDHACFVVKCGGIERPEVKSFTDLQTELISRYRDRQFDMLARETVAELYDKAEVRPENPGRFLLALVEAAPMPGGARQ